jgi:hypothetical protein
MGDVKDWTFQDKWEGFAYQVLTTFFTFLDGATYERIKLRETSQNGPLKHAHPDHTWKKTHP